MTSGPPSQCLTCTHFRPPMLTDGAPEPTWPGGTGSCDAYPNRVDAIPADIWWNRADHREPQPGDHGIQWDSFDGEPYPQWVLQP